jgi:hypothetical protein
MFTYHRSTDGCDETFNVLTPTGHHLLSIPFWDEADRAEAEARLVVEVLNSPALESLASVIEATVPALGHLRAVLLYARNEAGMLGLIDDKSEGARKAWEAVKKAQEFLDSQEFLDAQEASVGSQDSSEGSNEFLDACEGR